MICEYIERGNLLQVNRTQEFINPLAELIGVRFRNEDITGQEGYLPSLTIEDPEWIRRMKKFPFSRKCGTYYGFCFAFTWLYRSGNTEKGFGITPVACVGIPISWQVNRLYAEDALKGLNHPGPAEGKYCLSLCWTVRSG